MTVGSGGQDRPGLRLSTVAPPPQADNTPAMHSKVAVRAAMCRGADIGKVLSGARLEGIK
jgi:hypothetical protein